MDSTVPLGRTNVRVSRLGIGAMTWGAAHGASRWHPAKLAYGGAAGIEEERAAVQASLAAGVTFFDTAAMYSGGASEIRLGELTRHTDAVIATKFPPGIRDTAEDLPAALRASLSRLGRQQVDLYMHHFPSRRVDVRRLMHLMADAVDAGHVRAVGVSNYSADQLRQAHAALAERGLPLASNQVEYSLLHRQPESNGVLDACRELGVTLICYQPLAGGALTGKYLDARPPGLRRFMLARYFRADSARPLAPVIALLREIGERHDRTPAQVALRWLIEQDALPIPGAKNARQAASNAGALTFALEAAEVDELTAATRAWR